MKELIDKTDLVAEIEKLKAYLQIPNAQLEAIQVCDNVISVINAIEVKEVDLEKEEDKLDKAIKLADAMYYAAQQLTTDASRLHKAMQDWWKFKNYNL